ncbi:SHUGOSHIN 2 isoform X2 [Argentina anserina]|uniref:SHUGOSHIN 2 isoform X2 n=1 Tax=Argentina anserina TaxID=57926 RepID=UPI00217669F6|nr:SHUGOSHIN 2 isoform X2 [Potentilla anserina]
MDAFLFDESENSGAGGATTKKEKKGKGCLAGSARKTLGDISNIQQRQNKLAIQHVKQEFDSLTTKKYVENLTKENMALMKLLSDRNKVIELSRTELQNLRANLEKVQQQNSQLAYANSQMLAEVTSSRDRLRVLQHALGCQNALLKVKKVEEKVGSAKCVEPDEYAQAINENFNTNRKWQPQNLALGPPIVEAIQNNEKADNKRRTRRQSAIFEMEDQETTVDSFEIKDDNKRRLRRQLASAKTEEPQATEDLSESKNENIRILRRQSARFKTEKPEVIEETKVTEGLCEINDDNFLVSPLCGDVVHVSDSTLSLVKTEDGERSEEQESQKSSTRPLRRAAEKVKSYKEIPINVKMRRGDNLTTLIGS